MRRFLLPGTLALLAAGSLLASVAGCSKKLTTADPGYTSIEGIHSPNALMFVWAEPPDTIQIWTDLGNPGPAPEGTPEVDTIQSTYEQYRTSPSVLHIMILDATPASGYQIFRRDLDGGFAPLADYVLNASRKWIDTGWEVYETTDPHPSGFSPATYVGRGLVSGVASANSPLTNLGTFAPPIPTASISYIDSGGPGTNSQPYDSLFRMTWTPIPGAAGYWIHIYQFKANATPLEIRHSGSPSPIWNGNVEDYFVGYVPAPANSYKLGDPGAQVLRFRPPIHQQVYLVRITAVDALGRIRAYMHGSQQLTQGDGTYEIAPLAAQAIQPKVPGK